MGEMFGIKTVLNKKKDKEMKIKIKINSLLQHFTRQSPD